MSDPRRPLEELEAKLRAKRGEAGLNDGDANKRGEAPQGLGLAMRIGTELAAGLAVGIGIGYGLDLWFGTKPWLVIVFFILGAAAGFVNVYRVVNRLGLQAGYRDGGGPDKS